MCKKSWEYLENTYKSEKDFFFVFCAKVSLAHHRKCHIKTENNLREKEKKLAAHFNWLRIWEKNIRNVYEKRHTANENNKNAPRLGVKMIRIKIFIS